MKQILILVISIIFLLCSCNVDRSKADNPSKLTTNNLKDVLKIYADNIYRDSITKTINNFKNNNRNIDVVLSENISDADIVLEDNLRSLSPDDYTDMSKRYNLNKNLFISGGECVYNKKIIGLPLFLNINGLWFDLAYLKDTKDFSSYNINALKENNLKIAVNSSNISPFFWSVFAPLILSNDNTKIEIFKGDFKNSDIKNAVEKINQLHQNGVLLSDEDAFNNWMHHKFDFYCTDFWVINQSKNLFSSESEITFQPSLIFTENEKKIITTNSVCVFCKIKSNQDTINKFLDFLYQNDTLSQMVNSSEIPLCCRLDFSKNTWKQSTQRVYNIISSNQYDLIITFDMISSQKYQALANSFKELLNNEITVDECVSLIQ